MLKKYKKYLEFVDSYINKCFEDQKPYIHCKEGCSLCCEIGLYPYTELEFDYLKSYIELLDTNIRQKIYENISEIRINREYGEKKYFQCPLLIDKKCSVYANRGIICRTFGLMHFSSDKDDKTQYHIPSCVSYGLNYSEVYDEENQTISQEKFEKTEHEVEPLSYNLGHKYLTNNERTKDIDFGECRAIIDWFD